jgi:2-polyprenyl-6-methoxyphenol hydroxylase-like FAD-dependent oxidoreductase
MRAEVRELVVGGGVVRGVRWTGPEGPVETRALLTVGADGRSSRTRALAGLHAVAASPPMDVLWFRLTRRPDDGLASTLRFGEGHLVALLERDTSWQVGWIVPKGAQPEAEPIEDLRDAVVAAVPELADRVGELRSWADVSRLTVRADRLRRWYVPGYLAIGDAAHAMSPVGGVGINVAIQDAVSAANALWRPLGRGRLSTGDLRRVQRRRALPVRMIQGVQAAMHRGLVTPALERRSRATALGLRAARLLRRPFARMIALGPLRPRVRSPGPTRPGGRPRGGG